MLKTRLLLAEDNADHQRLLISALTNGRPQVELCVVATREEVLANLRGGRFDCLVLDFNLPPFDAPTILRDARELLEETPVIVISSIAEQGVVIESMRTGVADFVPKERAIEADFLWGRVQSAMERARKDRTDRRRLQRRIETLRQRADQDPLTGLGNRRFGARLLSSERHRKDRRQVSSCIAIDLDHFKAVNDTYGHAAGDVVLSRVADLLRRHAAPSDAVMRWGGEEFLVIKSSTPPAPAWIWADQVRRDVAQMDFRFQGRPCSLTASFGVATLSTINLSEASIHVADRALYMAKDLGRNRVCTEAMVQAYDAALGIHSESRPTTQEQISALIAAIGPMGETQMEHIGPHSRRVRDLAAHIGRAMKLGEDSQVQLETAALLHDIGKAAIPEELLATPRRLTPDEKRLVDEHTKFGAEMCSALGLGEPVTQAVAQHHNRYDAGEACTERGTQASRIISVADAFVSMTSRRPYTPQRTPKLALEELRSERGRQFDPEIVDTIHLVDPKSLADGEAECGARELAAL